MNSYYDDVYSTPANFEEVDWQYVLSKLQEGLVINMNYGAPASMYVPMASYKVIGLIDITNGYSRSVLGTTKPKGVLVELEKFGVNPGGDIVPDHSYKLYIPLIKLIDEKVVELARKNAEDFQKKLSGEATAKNVSIIASGLQFAIASNE